MKATLTKNGKWNTFFDDELEVVLPAKKDKVKDPFFDDEPAVVHHAKKCKVQDAEIKQTRTKDEEVPEMDEKMSDALVDLQNAVIAKGRKDGLDANSIIKKVARTVKKAGHTRAVVSDVVKNLYVGGCHTQTKTSDKTKMLFEACDGVDHDRQRRQEEWNGIHLGRTIVNHPDPRVWQGTGMPLTNYVKVVKQLQAEGITPRSQEHKCHQQTVDDLMEAARVAEEKRAMRDARRADEEKAGNQTVNNQTTTSMPQPNSTLSWLQKTMSEAISRCAEEEKGPGLIMMPSACHHPLHEFGDGGDDSASTGQEADLTKTSRKRKKNARSQFKQRKRQCRTCPA